MRVQHLPLLQHPVAALLHVTLAAATVIVATKAVASASRTTASSTCSFTTTAKPSSRRTSILPIPGMLSKRPRAFVVARHLTSTSSSLGDDTVPKESLGGGVTTPVSTSRSTPSFEDDDYDRRGGGGTQYFPRPPLLAVLTEPDAVSTEERSVQTIDALKAAIVGSDVDDDHDGTNVGVSSSATPDLISVRVALTEDDEDRREEEVERVIALVRRIRGWSRRVGGRSTDANRGSRSPIVVINAGEAVVSAEIAQSCHDANDGTEDDDFFDIGGVGVHVKERDLESVPKIRTELLARNKGPVIVGASVHSVESALRAAELGVDYLIVGTCYPTPSHPEKSDVDDLEGPELPGMIKKELISHGFGAVVAVFGIGGIDAGNCADVIRRGADGVAVMRGVLRADHPDVACRELRVAMVEAVVGNVHTAAGDNLNGDR